MNTVAVEAELVARAAALLTARVEKRDHSRGAWRVVTADGVQITTREPYPGWTEQAMQPVDVPVCADRKWDAEQRLEALRILVAGQLRDAVAS